MIVTSPILGFVGPAGDAFAAGAGVAAAALLLGGPILLRFQRQRQQFLLTQAAIEKGVTVLPRGAPAWLQSTRTGVMLLALGVSILICGVVSVGMSRNVAIPDRPTTQPAQMEFPGRPQDEMGPRGGLPGGPPGGFRDGPRGGREEGGAQRRPGMDGEFPRERMEGPGPQGSRPEGDRNGPPPLDPVMDRWRQSRAERAIGLIAIAGGFILSVMGVARLIFARVERRYEPIAESINA